jgi:hypothetical protein
MRRAPAIFNQQTYRPSPTPRQWQMAPPVRTTSSAFPCLVRSMDGRSLARSQAQKDLAQIQSSDVHPDDVGSVYMAEVEAAATGKSSVEQKAMAVAYIATIQAGGEVCTTAPRSSFACSTSRRPPPYRVPHNTTQGRAGQGSGHPLGALHSAG